MKCRTFDPVQWISLHCGLLQIIPQKKKHFTFHNPLGSSSAFGRYSQLNLSVIQENGNSEQYEIILWKITQRKIVYIIIKIKKSVNCFFYFIYIYMFSTFLVLLFLLSLLYHHTVNWFVMKAIHSSNSIVYCCRIDSILWILKSSGLWISKVRFKFVYTFSAIGLFLHFDIIHFKTRFPDDLCLCFMHFKNKLVVSDRLKNVV